MLLKRSTYRYDSLLLIPVKLRLFNISHIPRRLLDFPYFRHVNIYLLNHKLPSTVQPTPTQLSYLPIHLHISLYLSSRLSSFSTILRLNVSETQISQWPWDFSFYNVLRFVLIISNFCNHMKVLLNDIKFNILSVNSSGCKCCNECKLCSQIISIATVYWHNQLIYPNVIFICYMNIVYEYKIPID